MATNPESSTMHCSGFRVRSPSDKIDFVNFAHGSRPGMTVSRWIRGSSPRMTNSDERKGTPNVQQVEVAVIGTGWCGGIRAETLARSSLVDKLHICEIRPDRLAEVKRLTNAATATLDYQDIVKNDRIKVVYISTTPESTHYPIARDCLKAGKHVLLEKPIALELFEADELIEIARRGNLKFTIGYSQRFNPRLAYAKKKLGDGTLGKPVSVMVSRHLSRGLGKKIASRGRLSPAAMESTHDLDFVFWLLEPAKPIRVY